MASTQDNLPIVDVKNNLAIMRDGSMALILHTSAVNFDLLSEREQMAIIGSFASTLNSLSFAIQILIRSKRLDVTSYLKLLADAQAKQKNPLLYNMMLRYRSFIEQTVQENNVLDKKFYIVIAVSGLELGIGNDIATHLPKAETILIPRRDHIMKQLANLGLKPTQLDNEQIIRLFYDYYNPPADIPIEQFAPAPEAQKVASSSLDSRLSPKSNEARSTNQEQTSNERRETSVPPAPVVKMVSAEAEFTKNEPIVNEKITVPTPPTPLAPQPVQTSHEARSTNSVQPATSNQSPPLYANRNTSTPYVVEELDDDYTSLAT